MSRFGELLVPRTGRLSAGPHGWVIEVPLETFSADREFASEWRPGTDGPALIETSIWLEPVPLPTTSIGELIGKSFDFPVNPDPGYIDGSIYLGASHNPVDVRRIEFGELVADELTARLVGVIVFEFELEGEPNHEFDLDVRLKVAKVP